MLVVAVGEVFFEVCGGMEVNAFAAGDADDEDVLLVGNAALAIVDDLAVAIEGEAVFDIATDVEDGDGFVERSDGCQALSQGARGVGAVKDMDDALGGVDLRNAAERAYSIEQEH